MLIDELKELVKKHRSQDRLDLMWAKFVADMKEAASNGFDEHELVMPGWARDYIANQLANGGLTIIHECDDPDSEFNVILTVSSSY